MRLSQPVELTVPRTFFLFRRERIEPSHTARSTQTVAARLELNSVARRMRVASRITKPKRRYRGAQLFPFAARREAGGLGAGVTQIRLAARYSFPVQTGSPRPVGPRNPANERWGELFNSIGNGGSVRAARPKASTQGLPVARTFYFRRRAERPEPVESHKP
jgi:hypothetical protein